MSEMMSVRIDKKIKEEASKYLKQLGLTPSQATRLFLYNIVLHKGLPFELKIPTEKTIEALNQSNHKKNIKKFSNPQEMFDKLGI